MDIRINKGTAYGTVAAPPSKSYGHRLLICAALSMGKSIVEGISSSDDMRATINCINSLGIATDIIAGTVTLNGTGERTACTGEAVFECNESGSTLRFFIPIALALTGGGIFMGTERLIERGIGVYEELFSPMGINIDKEPGSIKVSGRLESGNYSIRGDVSSQFVSGLLFALPLLEKDSTLTVIPPVESRAYIDITIDCMRQFGVIVEEFKENSFRIKGMQKYMPGHVKTEGDWSNAAFLYAIAKLSSPEGLLITGLNENSLQGDKVCVDLFNSLMGPDKKVIDISGCPDLGPVLFAFAAATGGGRFTGIKRLRIKESDRAAAMSEELSKFGISTIVSENDMEVLPGQLMAPEAAVNGHNDHRIVMSMAILLLLTGGVIEGAEAVNKSYPDFFKDLNSIGIRTKKEERNEH